MRTIVVCPCFTLLQGRTDPSSRALEDQGGRGAGDTGMGCLANNHSLLEPIGYIPPAEAEANYYRQLASQAATAE